MALPLHIGGVVVCDQIRREDNGKALLIGVYVADILLSSFERPIVLSFYLTGMIEHSGSAEVNIKIQHSLASGVSPAAFGNAKVAAGQVGRSAAIVFQDVALSFDQPTELIVSVQEGDDWRVIDRKHVALLTTPSSEPQQPS